MENENSPIKILEGINIFLDNLPSNPYYSHINSYLNIEGYGSGEAAFSKLKADFQGLDLSEVLKSSELDKKIKNQKKELASLEKKHASLVSIFGEDGGGSEGTLTHKLLEALEKETVDLIIKRDKLKTEVNDADQDFKIKLKEIDSKLNVAELDAKSKIQNATNKAIGKVRIIEQFSDFLAETNSNMQLYFWVILFLTLGSVATIALSVPSLLKCFDSYDTFITSLGVIADPWQILNYAFGILIVKLPWALCLSAVFTGMYSLLKSLLITYEKINQDKRNMSAIYAVSGNIAEALNDYGLSIAIHDVEDDETGEFYTILRAPNKQVNQKRESLKWNQIMNYFERMQHHKNDDVVSEDPSKLKLVSDVLNKLIDRLPQKS